MIFLAIYTFKDRLNLRIRFFLTKSKMNFCRGNINFSKVQPHQIILLSFT